jgi:phosphoribosylformylglycinamidine synthase
MMLSESQERMLMVLKPGREAFAEAIFHKWDLDFAVIGEVTDTGHMVLEWNGEVVCDIPLGPLADDAPLYERPYLSRDDYQAWAGVKPLDDLPQSTDVRADLLKLMASPNIASRRWIWEQYDSQVGADTVQTGGDAAVVRVHGTQKALAMTTDCTPRYCYASPHQGGRQAIAEAYRNLTAVGARPLAVTNCLNFGNPQRPEIMAQIVGCLEGMSEACVALDFPIVSGNVSLYNESKATGGGSAILPTPAIGGVGLLGNWQKSATIAFKDGAQKIYVLGGKPTDLDEFGQSLWLRECHGRSDGPPPSVDLAGERQTADFIRSLIAEGAVTSVHDISDGGPLVAVAEMALAGDIGATLVMGDPSTPSPCNLQFDRSLFAENQGRYIVTEPIELDFLEEEADRLDIQYCFLGWTGGESIAFEDEENEILFEIPLADIRAAHEGFFPTLMQGEL